MSKSKKILPELRFPEFKDSGEWDVKKISDLGETISGLTGKSKDDFGAGKPFVTYKQVFDNSVINFEQCERVQIKDDENQNSLQQGDILFTTSSETPNEVGFASVLIDFPKEKTYLNSFCFALRPFNIEKTQPQFSRYLFHSPIYRRSVTAIAQGSTRYNLSKGAFIEIQVPIPAPPEQQKIASCLSSLDEVIEAHSKKLELLKDHKKGLMQNLFPQEGEKVPKLRFKEFENSGEWEEKKIEDVVIAENSNIALNKLNLKSSGYPVYGADGIIGYIDDFQQIDKYISIVKDGAGVGRLNLCENQSSLLGTLTYLKSRNLKSYDLTWIYYLLNTVDFFTFVKGSGIPHIYYSDYKNKNIVVPNLSEQQKIASCFSSLDEIIEAQTEAIEQLKLHKKGLMQGLFPKISD